MPTQLKRIIKRLFYLNVHTEHFYHLIILRLFKKKLINNSFDRKNIKKIDYFKAFEDNILNTYPAIDEIEKNFNYKINQDWFNQLALITQITIKKSKVCYAHGRVLYSYLRKYLENQSHDFIQVFETGTSKGFSSLCMAKALDDSNKKGNILTVDILPHDKKIYWNSVSDFEGKKTRGELLDQWRYLIDKYISYLTGESKKIINSSILKRINFAYLDGSHTYYDVKREFEFVASLQNKSDIVIIDDYDKQYLGLRKAADLCCSKFNYNKKIIVAEPNRTYLICVKN